MNHETNALLVPNSALRWSPSSLAQIAPDVRPASLNDPPVDPPAGNKPQKKEGAQRSSRKTLWVKDGEFVRPIEVTAGISDGVDTAVTADTLHEADEVITGEIIGPPTGVSNPFLPKIIRR